jgi:hypothetical protein
VSATDDLAGRVAAINWLAIDPGAVCAFYDATGRPVEQRALLVPPSSQTDREAWQRQCLADLVAIQGRGYPTCTT